MGDDERGEGSCSAGGVIILEKKENSLNYLKTMTYIHAAHLIDALDGTSAASYPLPADGTQAVLSQPYYQALKNLTGKFLSMCV
jgi:hypothetical protein